MNKNDLPKFLRNNQRKSHGEINERLRLLWLLRIMVPLDGYKIFLREKDFGDDDIARVLGLGRYIDEDGECHDYDRKQILNELRRMWRQAERRGLVMPTDGALATNLTRLGSTLDLSETEMRIVHFSVLARTDAKLQSSIGFVGSLSLLVLEQLFAVCLDLDLDEVRHALSDDGTLFRTGILWLDLNDNYDFPGKVELLRGFTDELHRNHEDPLGLFRNNLVPSLAPQLTESHYPHLAKDIHTLMGYLGSSESQNRTGTNILIYGSPGSGKTEFVRMLAQHAGFKLYEVATENRKGNPLDGEDRFRAYRLAQSLLERRTDTLIMFDEIEDVFRETGDDSRRKGNQSGTKAWVNRLMEENPVPAFWITNNLHFLDPAVVRRFDYVLEMNAPPRSVRARILDDYLADLPISPSWKRQMAEHEDLVPAVVERAAKVVRSISSKLPPHEAETVLARVMGNTLEALALPRMPRSLSGMATNYRLDILNADCDVAEVCDGLAREQTGRLCLYGPPGTGKTAFGRHIAEALDRPLIVKRASDILSPYVGVAEKNMAKMFQDAADEGAVLLLDEADTFLQDRKGAQRSWEISEVNEMLTQMENFEGIFIASTNLMSSLDEAALRRFDLKMRFDYLKPEQSWLIFCDTAMQLGFMADETIESALSKLDLLTPGDFAVVARQARLRKICDSHDLFHRLKTECAAKPGGQKRTMGF